MKIQSDTDSPDYSVKATPFYFSFGCGSVFANHHVCIYAASQDEAREVMAASFGDHWCWVYTQDEWDAPSSNSMLSNVGGMAPYRLATIRNTPHGWKANV